MFKHMMHLPASFFDRTTSGETLSKITYNVEQVANACTDAVTVLVRESCTAVASPLCQDCRFPLESGYGPPAHRCLRHRHHDADHGRIHEQLLPGPDDSNHVYDGPIAPDF